MKRIQTTDDHNEILYALNACRLIGFKHRSAMEKHRQTLEAFKENTSQTDVHAGCTAVMDMLDGKRSGFVLFVWLVGWFGWLVCWFGWLVGLVGLVGWFACLFVCLVGWLVGWVGLVGLLVCLFG